LDLNHTAILAYKKNRRKCFALMILFCAALPALVCAAAGLGAMRIPAAETARILAGKLLGMENWYAGIAPGTAAVVWELRLPRIICSLCVGAGLGAAGVIFQAILQNPLADPYTLGVSSGAAFGASLAILLNLTLAQAIPVSLAALVFAGLALALVLLIASRVPSAGEFNGASLVMAGIIVSAILQAGISFMKMISGEQVAAIVFWLMGSLSARTWNDALLLAPVIIAATALAALFSGDLNALTLGGKTAETLGTPVRRTLLLYLFLGAAITAVCVSVCGIIGFVGLVVPHLLRLAVSPDNRFLLPLSALGGALLLATADTAARLVSAGEIPVGVLTTLLGGPFYIYILVRRRGGRAL
jgi:iron complex transport system permease protein